MANEIRKNNFQLYCLSVVVYTLTHTVLFLYCVEQTGAEIELKISEMDLEISKTKLGTSEMDFRIDDLYMKIAADIAAQDLEISNLESECNKNQTGQLN